MKAYKSVDEWDDTPVSQQCLVCPVCTTAFLEWQPAKAHFFNQHEATLGDTLLTEDDFLRHRDD
jgi:hypothetical protein